MYKLHLKVKQAVLSVLDFFYPMFRRLMPLQTFRYAACGGSNLLLSVILYPLIYNFILKQQVIHIGPVAISAHIATLFLVFLATFPVGFYLSMFVVFPGSHLRRNIQLFRYFVVSMASLALNYLFLKLFVGVFHWWSTPSYYVNVVLVTAFSYFSQRHFSFRKKDAAETQID
ncbi:MULTISPECIES: GtrA family protein [Chitinophagaceae]